MRRAAPAALVLAVLLGACSGGSDGADGAASTTTTAIQVTDTDWAFPGGNLDNSRATDDTTWSTATVGRADVAWEVELPGAGDLPTVPIVVDDVVYVGGTRGSLAAIDRATGHVRWSTKPDGFNIGPTGVAVATAPVAASRPVAHRPIGWRRSTRCAAIEAAATSARSIWS